VARLPAEAYWRNAGAGDSGFADHRAAPIPAPVARRGIGPGGAAEDVSAIDDGAIGAGPGGRRCREAEGIARRDQDRFQCSAAVRVRWLESETGGAACPVHG